MLNGVIGDLLPSALAVALSPIPIIAIVLVLDAPRARRAGPAFALGWIAGLVAVSVIVVPVLGAGGDPESNDAGISWFKVVIGILFPDALRCVGDRARSEARIRGASIGADHLGRRSTDP